MPPQVLRGDIQYGGVVLSETDHAIARITQQISHFSCAVIVVYVKLFAASARCFDCANCTAPTLPRQHFAELRSRKAVLPLQVTRPFIRLVALPETFALLFPVTCVPRPISRSGLFRMVFAVLAHVLAPVSSHVGRQYFYLFHQVRISYFPQPATYLLVLEMRQRELLPVPRIIVVAHAKGLLNLTEHLARFLFHTQPIPHRA